MYESGGLIAREEVLVLLFEVGKCHERIER